MKHKLYCIDMSKLQQGSAQLTSLNYLVQISCCSYLKNIFHLCKTSYINEEVKCIYVSEPSLSVSVSWF
jgi:hypothetical protein